MRQLMIRYGILSIGILCLIIGIVLEQYLEVLTKAINICLECIGIG